MGFLAKADALFVGLRVSQSYHQALQIADDDVSKLKAARRDIRNAIRTAGLNIQSEQRFWDSSYAAKTASARPAVQPKFFTQGSFAYDLLVAPCQKPPQQIDLDDGMYVLVDFLQTGVPALMAKALFAMVEEALRPLCEERRWKLTEKATCVRVELCQHSHVDIPIYSAPRAVAESRELTEAALAKGHVAKRAGKTYAKLPSNQIMLACRDGTWTPSDPLKLHDWVEGCVVRYGEDFRRACRYFKGWRDHKWTNGCLSSITIMAAVEKALGLLNGTHHSFADDRLVYEIAQLLPDIFQDELTNPAFPNERVVLNDWTAEERASVVAAARLLANDMERALKGTAVASLVVDALQRAFGGRIPNRPDAVHILPPMAAAVASVKPATVPAPRVTKSTSG